MSENLNNALARELRAMANNRLDNYIVPGLRSELLGGPEHGKVRLFTSTRGARDWITPHSHRFDFTSLVLAGEVHQTLFEPVLDAQRHTGEEWCRSRIDQVCGANGIREYVHTREDKPTRWLQNTTVYYGGDTYSMDASEIHSIWFERGTVVLFFEGPQVTPTGVMLEPWVNGKVLPTFRTEPWMFEKETP